MKLAQLCVPLFQTSSPQPQLAPDQSLPWEEEITSLCADSRQAAPGSAFFCLPGERTDGHRFAAQALERGAVAVFCQRDLGLQRQILVPDPRLAYGQLSAAFFGHPSQRLRLAAVTGTNGKTSTSWMLWEALGHLGSRAGLSGTICSRAGELELPSRYTTPDPWQLQGLLDRMVAQGCDSAVVEASSHALDQGRLEGCSLDLGLFLNLTPEHLDYHGTMEEYYRAKRSLFPRCRTGVVNLEDPYGRRLFREQPCPITGVAFGSSLPEGESLRVTPVDSTPWGQSFLLTRGGEQGRVHLKLSGGFWRSNGAMAAAALLAWGYPMDQVCRALSRCTGVPGRGELIARAGGVSVFRDYAHTPEGLGKILAALRPPAPGRLIALFGCPGCRDRENRPRMAREVASRADQVVFTADNPRCEPFAQICRDALPGLRAGGAPWRIIRDREEAIAWALGSCRPGDTLLLAGKGHEQYQVLEDRTLPFDEPQIVRTQLGLRRDTAGAFADL